MIVLKSPDEIERMRRAGRVTAETVERLMEAVRPGMTTADLDALAEESIRSEGCTPSFKGYRGFPASICTSVNDQVVHGIPSPRVLREGDLISLDVGAVWDGYHGDSAVTVFVGSPPSDVAEKLVRVTEDSLDAAISQIKVGARLSDLGHAVQQVVEGAGFSVVREYVGHGVGRALHEDPQIPNYG
ncbi:MAG TPA: type I methionyl aminopeptidase, partial [Actinomycetota bacterium]|nr:type I methionyl aminopeptidase [Actinomycetota bacterium]